MTESARTIVRGGHVLTMGPAGVVAGGAVAFDGDGTILAVGPFADLAGAHPDADVVGDDRGIVLPGLVNAHTHLSEALVPGMGEEMTLFEWGTRIVGPAGQHLTREMGHAGAMLKGAELLLSGATTVSDMFCHTNAGSEASLGAVDGLEAMGLRGIVSFGAEDTFDPHPVAAWMAEHEALADRCAATDRVGFRLGIGTFLGQSDALYEASVAAAKANGWGVHTHLAEVREELVTARLRWGRSTVEHALGSGLLELPTLAAHCVWVGQADLAAIAGTGLAACHNPVANMILASGVAPVPALRAAGIAVGIGTDGAASNDSQNMLEAVKTAALLQKVATLDPTALTARDVLAMATSEGARALGLDELVGSLEPGKRADVVRLHGHGAGLANVHDPWQQVVYCAGPADVADVWVDGRRLVADGSLTGHDLAALVEASRPLAADLVARAGLGAYSAL
jgi:cytosine/adenosine deaminase-related metal-dependent hydrolase